jgi:hypothetical protein
MYNSLFLRAEIISIALKINPHGHQGTCSVQKLG